MTTLGPNEKRIPLSPRETERLELPQHVLDMYKSTVEAEMQHHIFREMGYDCGALDDSEIDELMELFLEELPESDDDTFCPAACRAFARFCYSQSEPLSGFINASSVREWLPRTRN